MSFYKVNEFKVFLKTKEELIKMGYESNNDKEDFLNALAGRLVTINTESEDGKIFICKEFPEYAIYDYFVKSVKQNKRRNNTEDDLCSFEEIGKAFNITTQRAWAVCNKTIEKIKILAETKKEYFLN